MAVCKRCGDDFDWGCTPEGRWVPLEAVASDSNLPKSYVDPDGVLRADHRERCGSMPLEVRRLKKKIYPPQEPVSEPKKSFKERLKVKVPVHG